MASFLNIVAGFSGIIAGILWFFASAHTPIPPIGAYYDVTDSPQSSFAMACKKANKLNQQAAIATGISALLFGISGVWQYF